MENLIDSIVIRMAPQVQRMEKLAGIDAPL